jgi:Asp-tRNA(Asn)/Glu-tRNA(Gln) amidotransferase C subunit
MGQGPVTSEATGAKLRISYSKEGIPIEEEFYAVVETINIPMQNLFGTTYNILWYVDYIFSFKGEAGKLEDYTREFQIITSSLKVNPKWYAKYSNVIEYMAQQQITRINNIGEFSRMLSQMSDEMREDKMQQFKASGDVYDRVSEKFSDNTLGIDRYFDPHEGKEVELPSGYNHAWCNNNGEYIITDNPNFNPNEGSNLNWQPMKKK